LAVEAVADLLMVEVLEQEPLNIEQGTQFQ
jgi:hypothetical protein